MTTTTLDRLRPHRAGSRRTAPYGRYLAATVGLMAIASANGAARELTYGKAMGEDAAHALSFLPMVTLFALYVGWLERRWPLPTARAAIAVGGMWAAVAAGFELGLGRFVEGMSWSELLHDYDLTAGRVGGLVLVAAASLPSVVRLVRLRRAG